MIALLDRRLSLDLVKPEPLFRCQVTPASVCRIQACMISFAKQWKFNHTTGMPILKSSLVSSNRRSNSMPLRVGLRHNLRRKIFSVPLRICGTFVPRAERRGGGCVTPPQVKRMVFNFRSRHSAPVMVAARHCAVFNSSRLRSRSQVMVAWCS